MRLAVVIILVVALTILLFEEALSRISKPRLKPKLKRMKISRSKLKTTRHKTKHHTTNAKPKIAKKPGAGATEVHKHRGFGGGTGLYTAQVATETVSSLGTTGSSIASTVLQNRGAKNEAAGEADQQNEEEKSESTQ
ncbi:uncharacterized protein LOC119374511 [Rhipicephalus sanguineus]|uniref:uncharacterized protein LOC119374511 n=1 Tax=Rhipicephalus sanguineus TaxID=34632 RepID=UPI00189370BA|nr:uncharacterized protein LOC119374511 [Rhipicephalus sanguineus]XP_049276387.1 uncharacterized protein LOC119374511 [Rhipicephalus sanguineus]